MLKVPVLFLIFNRPDLTEKVFGEIKKVKPEKLFLAADGHRLDKTGEAELCRLTRDIVLNNIDWECEVHTLLRDENLGCKIAVSSAITWFFDNVESGIILEDDILPKGSFFSFCEEMLIRYKDDKRVTTVCGANLMGESDIAESYLFSKMFGVWGWASWSRTWKLYDGDIKSWGNKKSKKRIRKFLGDKKSYNNVKGNLDLVYTKQFDTWDYQMVYTQLNSQSLSIIPVKNLVVNIGFREDATHTKHPNEAISSIMKHYKIIPPLQHPKEIIANKIYDTYYFSLLLSSDSNFEQLYKKARAKIKNCLKWIYRKYKL